MVRFLSGGIRQREDQCDDEQSFDRHFRYLRSFQDPDTKSSEDTKP
jgi:hypothetical protein